MIGPKAAWLPENHLASLAIVASIVAAVTLGAVRGLEWGKWIHNIGGIAMITAFVRADPASCVGALATSIGPTRDARMQFGLTLPPFNLRSMALFGQMLVGR